MYCGESCIGVYTVFKEGGDLFMTFSYFLTLDDN